MPKQFGAYCKLLLAMLVLFLSAGMLLPGDTNGVAGRVVVQKEQAPRFMHLLAEVSEELSEEDATEFHKIVFTPEGDFTTPAQPSIDPLRFSVATYAAVPVTAYKLGRHIRFRVLRI